MTANEVVSEPANMKVLMLCRMSSSDIRCSGGRSVAALDLTMSSQNEYDETEDRVENVRRSESRSRPSYAFPLCSPS